MITKDELKQINGGGINLTTGLFIGGIITFLIGLFDGYVRPLACN